MTVSSVYKTKLHTLVAITQDLSSLRENDTVAFGRLEGLAIGKYL
jgi:hypothetical protein